MKTLKLKTFIKMIWFSIKWSEKGWYTIKQNNQTIDKYIEYLENHLRKTNTILPLPVSKLIKISTLCTPHFYFQHNNSFYKQKFALLMGSPLNGVLACIYLEFFESAPFKCIIPSNSSYFRYIGDILLLSTGI